VFSAPRQDRAAALQAGREKHEAELVAVEAAEAADGYDDPLEPYVKFVKWTIDNYPAGQTAESGIIPLVERTARRFKDDPRYKSDLRYLKVWVTYAGYVRDPKVIYQHLLANEIGTHYALLYEEYAGVLEKAGRCVI
jgi:checkpoint serine/threonine-protein kinase